MRKKIPFIGSLILLLLLAQMPVLAQEKTVDITFYYYRSNGDFEGWSLWLWIDGQQGQSYEFAKDDTAASIQLRVNAEDKVGFILYYGEWEKKDVEKDRFIDLSEAKNGRLEVHVLEGTEEIYYSDKDLPMGNRFLKTDLDDTDLISFCYQDEDGSLSDCQKQIWITDESGNELEADICIDSTDGNRKYGRAQLKTEIGIEESYYINSSFSGSRLIEAAGIFDTEWFREQYTYEGDDLGASYESEKTIFKIWAPTAKGAAVNLYKTGDGDDRYVSYDMARGESGTWTVSAEGDLNGVYYTYTIFFEEGQNEVVDPYARTTGINGERGMVCDMAETDPEGFAEEEFERTDRKEAVVYELSVRDFTIDQSSGNTYPGTFLGLAEEGTRNQYGEPTGLDYLSGLGISYIQLMPSQDSDEVDERMRDTYNWGYMTSGFFVPEGLYATNPEDGEVRIREFKQMVQKLHEKGIGIIMDVVYNHTSSEMSLEKIVPGYYYRMNEDGSYSNGSACGNELATERSMAGKLIIDSCTYWAKEYHIDGFRFDLMGLFDMETMQLLEEKLLELDDGLILYGEGWNAGDTVYEGEVAESPLLRELAVTGGFNNVFRRGIQNYICSVYGNEDNSSFWADSVKFGIVGALRNAHTEDIMGSWTHSAYQSVNYTTCHDGYTLWDLLNTSFPDAEEEELAARNRLGIAAVMLAEGTPFWQSGEEFLRTKSSEEEPDRFNSNSYNAGDEINSIKWNQIHENQQMIAYYQGLMRFRKAHSGFAYETSEELEENLTFVSGENSEVIAYRIKEKNSFFTYNIVYVILNPCEEEIDMPLWDGEWKVCIEGNRAGTETLSSVSGDKITIQALSAMVMFQTRIRPAVIGTAALFLAAMLVVLFSGLSGRRKKGRLQLSR